MFVNAIDQALGLVWWSDLFFFFSPKKVGKEIKLQNIQICLAIVCQTLIVKFEIELGDFEGKACLLILDQVCVHDVILWFFF